jgi:nucleoid-associated protein YgaU
VLALGSALMGCARDAGTLDERDRRDPGLQKAKALEKANDIDGAIEVYQQSLDRKPALARAHLELGLLYEQYKSDYLRAVYHYQRYIELRPTAEKRELIEGLIRKARINFAASLPGRSSEALKVIADLQKENALLKAEIAMLSGVETTTGPAVAAQSSSTPRPAPAQPAVTTYTVKRGDTLSSIAAKHYGDARKWQAIYDANRSSLPSPKALRLGQTLIIPSQ